MSVELIPKAAENRGWVDANYVNLTEKYGGRRVAKAVIDSDRDLQELARSLRKKNGIRKLHWSM